MSEEVSFTSSSWTFLRSLDTSYQTLFSFLSFHNLPNTSSAASDVYKRQELSAYGVSQLNKKDGAFSDKKKMEKLSKATITSAGSGLVSGVKTTIGDHYNWRQDLEEKCWPGYEKKGMKTMFGKRYPNCVKKSKKKK